MLFDPILGVTHFHKMSQIIRCGNTSEHGSEIIEIFIIFLNTSHKTRGAAKSYTLHYICCHSFILVWYDTLPHGPLFLRTD